MKGLITWLEKWEQIMAIIKVKPSEMIWDYYKGKLTIEAVVSAIADRIDRRYISYSTRALLKDLKYITPYDNINKEGKELLATYLHHKFHHGFYGATIVNPHQEILKPEQNDKQKNVYCESVLA